MTKRILLLAFVALWCLCSLPFANAQDRCGEDQLAANTIVVQKRRAVASAAAPSCATAIDACTGTPETSLTFGDSIAHKYAATIFIADANADNVCKVVVSLKRTGDLTGRTVTAEIWSNTDVGVDGVDDDDNPTSKIGTGSSAVDVSAIGDAAYEDVTFPNMDVDGLVSGTPYWVVLIISSTAASTGLIWAAEANDCSGDGEELRLDNEGAGTWSSGGSSVACKFQLYKQ
jgi:hypothetical protein